MFTQKKVLRLYETDASGVLYFAQQFKMAQELFEQYLEEEGFLLGEHLQKGDYLLPIVHAEANFLAPIRVGDALKLTLRVERIGDSSFTLCCDFVSFHQGTPLGNTSIVHVVIARKAWSAVPIPETLKKILESLKPLS